MSAPNLARPGRRLRLLLLVSVLVWCAGLPGLAAAARQTPELPPDTAFSDKAGREERIIVKLHLRSGEELPCLLDTGCSVTILNRSLEPLLGASLGSQRLGRLQGRTQREKVFQAPDRTGMCYWRK